MRSDETLREYTNHYFENRNTLADVKYDDVIAYYKKGITNIKLFKKIHEADAKTIGDLMAYVDKLVDMQDEVMHDFNGEDHNDRGTRSCKRSGEAYVVDPPRPSTFLEGDFNMVMDDQCQFHRDAKHTMRECEQLKRALGVQSTGTVANVSTIVTVDLIDDITVTAGPILAITIGIDVIIAVMTDATNIVAMTATIGVTTTEAIIVMIVTTTDEMTGVMIDVARTTTIARTVTRGGNPNGAFQKANREINFIVGGCQVIKSNKQTQSNAREIRHVNTENRDLYGGLNSQSLSPGKIIGFTSLTPEPIRWSSTP
jgi:hypothetical protein